MQLVYEGNPKHKLPWQSGRKGSLCPPDIGIDRARELLRTSIAEGNRRYAVDQGRPFCAQPNSAKNRWHGYPIGWVEVPDSLRERLRVAFHVSNSEVRRFWRDVV